jgi:hypothetical protein
MKNLHSIGLFDFEAAATSFAAAAAAAYSLYYCYYC